MTPSGQIKHYVRRHYDEIRTQLRKLKQGRSMDHERNCTLIWGL